MPATPLPKILILLPRGEAVRNVVYTSLLSSLREKVEVHLLSVVEDEAFLGPAAPYVASTGPLKAYREHKLTRNVRALVHEAHFRWLDSAVARNKWDWDAAEATSLLARLRLAGTTAVARTLAFRPVINRLAAAEDALSRRLRPTRDFDRLYDTLQPDLVFNASHIHGVNGGGLAVRIARERGIPTAAFIFSWDNLTSRSRIHEPYDHYFTWHEPMRRQLLDLYPHIPPHRVTVTGTPQFDFHFQPQFQLTRQQLAAELGLDPRRPFILYTTAVAPHFPDEIYTVRALINLLHNGALPGNPQLVLRIYPKVPDPRMMALVDEDLPDVIIPPMLWERQYFTPRPEDQPLYTGLLRHCAVGVNAASTVSLELMMHAKPVINLGFDPPGSRLPHHMRWAKHLDFDHYRPVVNSYGVRVAYTLDDLAPLLRRALTTPDADRPAQCIFLEKTFGDTLDGRSADRLATALLTLVPRATDE